MNPFILWKYHPPLILNIFVFTGIHYCGYDEILNGLYFEIYTHDWISHKPEQDFGVKSWTELDVFIKLANFEYLLLIVFFFNPSNLLKCIYQSSSDLTN